MGRIERGRRPEALQWVQGQLARFTYKPGYILEVHPPVNDLLFDAGVLWVRYKALDSRQPPGDNDAGRIIPVMSAIRVPGWFSECRDEKQFADWLMRMLWGVEEHESREWLRRDGEIYSDPHKEGQ